MAKDFVDVEYDDVDRHEIESVFKQQVLGSGSSTLTTNYTDVAYGFNCRKVYEEFVDDHKRKHLSWLFNGALIRERLFKRADIIPKHIKNSKKRGK